MANNQVDLGKVTPVEGEDLSVLEHISYDSANDKMVSDKPIDAPRSFEMIKDKNGNFRFIEGNGVGKVTTGVTYTYAKWSLSGTHLMLVFAGKLDANAQIPQYGISCDFTIPQWVADKLIPQTNVFLDFKKIPTTSTGYTPTNTSIDVYVYKYGGTKKITIDSLDTYNVGENDEYFRIVFDFLIDNE